MTKNKQTPPTLPEAFRKVLKAHDEQSALLLYGVEDYLITVTYRPSVGALPATLSIDGVPSGISQAISRLEDIYGVFNQAAGALNKQDYLAELKTIYDVYLGSYCTPYARGPLEYGAFNGADDPIDVTPEPFELNPPTRQELEDIDKEIQADKAKWAGIADTALSRPANKTTYEQIIEAAENLKNAEYKADVYVKPARAFHCREKFYRGLNQSFQTDDKGFLTVCSYPIKVYTDSQWEILQAALDKDLSDKQWVFVV